MERTKTDIIRGVMLGHAVADAVGVPAEFKSRETLKADPVTDMREFGTHHQPRGTFSDDTSMSIAALDAIKGGELDYLGVMKNFAAWYNDAAYTSSGVCFDIGGSCLRAITSFTSSGAKTPRGHAESGEFSCGNGGLMRIHPFALYAYYKTDDTLERLKIIHDATALTHAHPRCLLASGIFSLILWELMNNPDKGAFERGISLARHAYSQSERMADKSICAELGHFHRILISLSTTEGALGISEDEIRSTGYTVDTLEAAIWCILTTNDYKSAVLRAVNLGSDTDTVAAACGALAGALYGVEGIPEEWLGSLVGRESIEAMCRDAAEGFC